MPWIQRENGLIIGAFANRQEGFAEEWLSDEEYEAELIASAPPPPPDWIGLLMDLRGSEVWGKAIAASNASLPANTALTLLIATITATRNLQALVEEVGNLRAAMADSVGDFDFDDLDWLNGVLMARHFPITLD